MALRSNKKHEEGPADMSNAASTNHGRPEEGLVPACPEPGSEGLQAKGPPRLMPLK